MPASEAAPAHVLAAPVAVPGELHRAELLTAAVLKEGWFAGPSRVGHIGLLPAVGVIEELLSDLAVQNLADRRVWELVENEDLARDFVPGEMFPGRIAHLFRV